MTSSIGVARLSSRLAAANSWARAFPGSSAISAPPYSPCEHRKHDPALPPRTSKNGAARSLHTLGLDAVDGGARRYVSQALIRANSSYILKPHFIMDRYRSYVKPNGSCPVNTAGIVARGGSYQRQPAGYRAFI